MHACRSVDAGGARPRKSLLHNNPTDSHHHHSCESNSVQTEAKPRYRQEDLAKPMSKQRLVSSSSSDGCMHQNVIKVFLASIQTTCMPYVPKQAASKKRRPFVILLEHPLYVRSTLEVLNSTTSRGDQGKTLPTACRKATVRSAGCHGLPAYLLASK